MPAPQTVLHQLAQFLGEQSLADVPDAGLLERFVTQHDETSFSVLVRRHGPRVLGVCQRLLGPSQDADDAFQASFLILARQGASLRKPQSLGAWLHGVAFRVANKARTNAARRRRHERQAGLARPAVQDDRHDEALALLDEELARLPERFREPLVLCHLDGLTQEEAARRASLLPRTLKARLERGRALLRKALERRGVRPCAIAGLLAPAGTVPGNLAGSAVRHAALFATRSAAPGEIPASVLSLAQGAVGSSVLPRACVVLLALLALGGLALGISFTPTPPDVRKAAPPALPAEEQRPVVDRHGDPLPEGALARLGTVRLRQGGLIGHAVLSRDGKMLVTMGADRVIRLWDARTGKPIRQFDSRDHLGCLALSADGKQLAYTDGWTMEVVATQTGERLTRWQVAEGKEQWTRVDYTSLAFSPDGKSLAGSTKLHTHVWKLSDGKQLHAFSTEDAFAPFRCLSFSADGKRLGTGGKTPAVWDLTTGKALARFDGHKSRVYCTALSGDGKTLAVGYDDGQIYLWNPTTGKADRVLSGHKNHRNVTALAFSGDGKTLFSTGRSDKSLRQWDVATGKQTATLSIDTYDGMNVAVSDDGKTLAVAGDNYSARIWHAKPQGKGAWEELALSEAHQSPVTMLAFSPDGKTLASAGYHGPARLWDVPSSKEIAVRGGLADRVRALGFSPDGKRLVLSGIDMQIRWCHPRTGEVERSRRWKQDSYATAVGFREGKTLVGGFSGKKLHLAEVDPEGETHPLKGHEAFLGLIAFSADGRTFVSSAGSELFVWDAAKGQKRWRLGDENHPADARSALALSADGKRLATADGSVIHVWDLTTGKHRVELRDHPERITALTFSRDGRWLASACDNHVIRLFETATWKLAGQFRGHLAETKALAFSPDSTILASASDDTSILLWDVSDRFGKDAKQAMTAQRLDALWGELEETPDKARRAIWALARSPKESVPFLRNRLGAKKVDAKRIDKLIAELDDDEDDVRTRATRELQSLGRAAAPAMRRALQTTESAEVKIRLGVCLRLLDSDNTKLRRLRALAVLDYAGTPEARRVLEALEKE